MSEQKVWVEKIPVSCSKCEWCTLNHKDNNGRPFCLMARMPLYNGDRLNEERGQHKDSLSDFDCPLHSIKDFERELVRQVFNEIKEQFGFIVDGKERIICDGSATGDKTILAILNQIQKEYEK